MPTRSTAAKQWHADPGVPLFRVDARLPSGVVRHTVVSVQVAKMRLVDCADAAMMRDAVWIYQQQGFV